MKICTSCKEEKEFDEFPWKNKENGIKAAYCKECKKKYNSTWYSKPENRKNQITRSAANKKKYLVSVYKWKLKYVAERGGCSWQDCDVVNPIAIDFDHLDPSQKSYDISRMISNGMSISAIEKEAEKCRLLCANHHRIHTAQQVGHTVLQMIFDGEPLYPI